MIPQKKIDQAAKDVNFETRLPSITAFNTAFTAGVRFAESEMGQIIRADQPWSLVAILQKLIDSSDYLLHEKDYDRTNHEGIEIAIKHGNDIVKLIQEVTTHENES